MRPERINLQSPIAWVLVALITTGGVVLSLAVIWYGTASSGPGRVAGVIGFLFLGPISLLAWLTLFTGLDRLVVDVPAGVIEHVRSRKVTSVALEELGPLTITAHRRLPGSRSATWHKLEAAGLPNTIILETISKVPVEKLKARLERAIAASAVRRILATYSTADGDVFRAAPELHDQLAAAVPDEGALRDALVALARDEDPDIRSRATQLASGVSTVPAA